MSFVNINVRMDQDLKKAFEEFCNDVGLSMSGVFTLFAKKTLRENRIPFDIGRDDPNAKRYTSAEDAFKDID